VAYGMARRSALRVLARRPASPLVRAAFRP